MNATHEEWRPVVGHDGYEVSNLGRVRSIDRVLIFKDGRSRIARGRILKSWPNGNVGHQCVGLAGSRRALVHILVLEAFVGPRPEGLVCCHNNGIPDDNRVENLRWDTYGENNKDLVRHGTHWQTAKTHCPQGHPYDSENTRVYNNPNGWVARFCRACEAVKRRERSLARSRMRAERRALVPPKKPGPKPKTHCKRGHEFTPENSYSIPSGRGRQCRKCNAIRQAEYQKGARLEARQCLRRDWPR